MARKTRKRRSFTAEYKADAVKLVKDSGKSVGQVAKDLDLTETALREWVKRSEGTSVRSKLSSDEREELVRLRRENRTLQMERDFANKAASSTLPWTLWITE